MVLTKMELFPSDYGAIFLTKCVLSPVHGHIGRMLKVDRIFLTNHVDTRSQRKHHSHKHTSKSLASLSVLLRLSSPCFLRFSLHLLLVSFRAHAQSRLAQLNIYHQHSSGTDHFEINGSHVEDSRVFIEMSADFSVKLVL